MLQHARVIHQIKEEVRSGAQCSMKSWHGSGSSSCCSMPSLYFAAAGLLLLVLLLPLFESDVRAFFQRPD